VSALRCFVQRLRGNRQPGKGRAAFIERAMAGAGTAQQQVFSPSSDEVPLAHAMDDLPFDLLLSGCGTTHSAALSAKRRALVFRL